MARRKTAPQIEGPLPEALRAEVFGESTAEGDPSESMARINSARRQVAEAAMRLEAAKIQHKLCKDEHDDAVSHLLSVIDEENQSLPLFEANGR